MADSTLDFQLKNLKLCKVTSTGKIVGRGAYAKVFEVHVHGTLCAAKEIYSGLVEDVTAQQSETMVKSFCEECVKTSQLYHPNIVQMLGIFYPTPQAKLPWLVMEMMETNLIKFLEKHEQGEIPLHFKLSILVDVAQGLEFLHSQNIIHMDLSSNNVFLTKNLVAKIANLGVAKVIETNKMKTLTQAPGAQHFMPPETLKNRPYYDKSVDVFSLACITLHVMSHQWPEPEDLFCEGSMIALTEIQRRCEYITFCTQPALRELVKLCLHNTPEERPEISVVCMKLKELKVTIEKQVPFATVSIFELSKVVQQVNTQNQILSTANKKLRDNVAYLETVVQKQDKDKHLVMPDKALQQIQEKDQQLQKKDQQIQEKDQQIQEKSRLVREKDRLIRGKDWQLQKKDQQIQEQDQQLQLKDQQIQAIDQEKDQQKQEKDQLIQEKDRQLQKKDKKIQENRQKTLEKDQQIREKDQLIREKDQLIRGKDRELQKKDQRMEEKDQQILRKDQEIQEKDWQIKKLNEVSTYLVRLMLHSPSIIHNYMHTCMFQLMSIAIDSYMDNILLIFTHVCTPTYMHMHAHAHQCHGLLGFKADGTETIQSTGVDTAT